MKTKNMPKFYIYQNELIDIFNDSELKIATTILANIIAKKYNNRRLEILNGINKEIELQCQN